MKRIRTYTEEQLIKRREYAKKYYFERRHKDPEYNKKCIDASKRWYVKNIEQERKKARKRSIKYYKIRAYRLKHDPIARAKHRAYGKKYHNERIRNDKDYRERYNEYARQQYKKHREKRIAYKKSTQDTHKNMARRILRIAIYHGQIIKPSNCSKCDFIGDVHGHHFDYSQPLNVIWLCSLCHGKEHQINSCNSLG